MGQGMRRHSLRSLAPYGNQCLRAWTLRGGLARTDPAAGQPVLAARPRITRGWRPVLPATRLPARAAHRPASAGPIA